MSKITDIFPVKEPKPYAFKKVAVPCANPEQIVGVELEVEGLVHSQEWYEEELSGIWQVKTDGSLRGRNNGNRVETNALEFISKPARIKILIPELAEFFERTGIKEENFTDRCSIHVHTNITDMDVQQVGTLFLIYSVVEDLLFRFVNYYGVADPRGKYRDTNIYCVPWNQCRMNADMVTKMFNDAEYVFRSWQKYTALNILPTRNIGTVEWRHMHGTANMEKLTLWLNMIGQIMKYAKEKKFEDVVTTIKELNNNSAYQQFLNDVMGEYVPYTNEVAKDLELGIVNAKYALMSMKDFSVKAKPKAKAKAVMFEQDVAEGMAGIAQWAEPFRPQPAAPAGAIPQIIPQVAPPRVNNVALARANRDIAERERRIRSTNAVLVYPVKRGQIHSLEHGVEWGLQDALGRLFSSEGFRRGGVGTRFDNLGLDIYCQGVGAAFWHNVDAEWRPAQERNEV
jgi:hypothetical protein